MPDPRTLAIELDEHLASTPMPATAHQRLRARLLAGERGAKPRDRRLWWVAAAALLGSLLGSLLALFVDGRPTDAEPLAAGSPPPANDGETVELAPEWNEVDPTCNTRSVDGTVELEGRCDLALMRPSLTVHSFGFARVRPTPRGVAVLDGWIAFDVAPIAQGHPSVVVEVPGGSIEVVGTRFSVWTDGQRGHVDLIEGRIRFHAPSGTRLLHPGERAQWHADDAATQVEPAHPPPRQVPRTDGNAEALAADLREVARLRGRGRHREALDIIERWMKRSKDRTVLETLSFERGTLLETTAGRSAVCRHWQEHRRRFGEGRYADAVRRRLRELGCS